MSKGTIIISAFPACGKTWCVNNLHDKFDMSDSDSSNFSWVYNKKLFGIKSLILC